MDTNTWLWIALIAFMIFCCLPMLRMGWRGRGRGSTRADRASEERGDGDRP